MVDLRKLHSAALALMAATSVLTISPLTVSAMAQVSPSAPAIALNSERVENFMQSFPKVKSLASELERTYDVPRGGSPTDGFAAFMTHQKAFGEMNGLVGQYGFADFSEWLQVLSAIVGALTFSAQPGGMDAQLAGAIASIENNKSLTPAQKQAMLQQMQAATQSLSAMRPSPENMAAIAGKEDALKALFEAE